MTRLLLLAAVLCQVTTVKPPPPRNLAFTSNAGREVLSISLDGKITYQGTPDEAATAFIQAVQKKWPEMCKCQKADPK